MEAEFKIKLESTNDFTPEMNAATKDLACTVMADNSDANVKLKLKYKNGAVTKEDYTTSGLSEKAKKLALVLKESAKKFVQGGGGDGEVKVELIMQRKV